MGERLDFKVDGGPTEYVHLTLPDALLPEGGYVDLRLTCETGYGDGPELVLWADALPRELRIVIIDGCGRPHVAWAGSRARMEDAS